MADNKSINLVDLQPGVRVRMAGGALAEIVENPQDGFWLIVRYLDNPAEPALVDAGEQQVFATDVEAIEP
ncbi:hypothetical protein H4P35_24240 [Achromobacter sp. 77]|jgi:hypothetical protein|uniref:hypothetical protein n=1 Tax=Achromobacter TaxID=222 RepID=UPI001D020438|nr:MULTISPECIES: hypothetical protein [Achromobacter]MCU6615787.1 hypothetical protein [Achromobacter mucicolens]UDG75258.1 hypothetical protein H4P35_24240 [Achromobacter sp. 77]